MRVVHDHPWDYLGASELECHSYMTTAAGLVGRWRRSQNVGGATHTVRFPVVCPPMGLEGPYDVVCSTELWRKWPSVCSSQQDLGVVASCPEVPRTGSRFS
jgi:hypothetical protein